MGLRKGESKVNQETKTVVKALERLMANSESRISEMLSEADDPASEIKQSLIECLEEFEPVHDDPGQELTIAIGSKVLKEFVKKVDWEKISEEVKVK